MAWTWLFIASLFEIAWTFSLKFLDFKKIKEIQWGSFFSGTDGFSILAPLLGYIVFGLGNIYFFSMAMKEIRASTAMAVWLGTTLIGIKLIDSFYFKEAFQPKQLIFFLFILIGVNRPEKRWLKRFSYLEVEGVGMMADTVIDPQV